MRKMFFSAVFAVLCLCLLLPAGAQELGVVRYAPQVAVGWEGEPGQSPYWTTEVGIHNTSGDIGRGWASFRASTGGPLDVDTLHFDGFMAHFTDVIFSMPGEGGGRFTTSRESQLTTGWIRFQLSSEQVLVNVIYQRRAPNGDILSQVGVPVREPAPIWAIPALSTATEETGVAILNPGEAPVTVRAEIWCDMWRAAPDYRPGTPYRTVLFQLAPGQKVAQFLSQMFPTLPPNDGGGNKISSGFVKLATVRGEGVCVLAIRSSSVEGDYIMGGLSALPFSQSSLQTK